jgi:hypothetical protein
MTELEIRHESEHVTIASHRTHTAAIMRKSSANDAWAHYQSTRVKYHNLELRENLVQVFGAKGGPAGEMPADDAAQKKKYEAQGKQIQEEARRPANPPKWMSSARCATISAKDRSKSGWC